MKKSKAIDFLTVTLFFGVLVSFMIYLGLSTFIGAESWEDDDRERVGFNDMFYSDELIGGFVRYCDYTLFGHIDSSDIMIGDEDWLFEATDSTNGYQRLLDYVGGCELTAQELDAISGMLSDRAESYEQEGIQYMMVVVPDSITICSDKVPAYLGRQSNNTRLRQLSRYMAGKSYFIDPTAILLAEKGIFLCITIQKTPSMPMARIVYIISAFHDFLREPGLAWRGYYMMTLSFS